jgi:opacity protein-like surface antigen
MDRAKPCAGAGALIAVLVILSAARPAHGQETGHTWIAGVFAGAAHTQPADVRLVEPDTDIRFSDVGFSGRSFESPIYYGYRLARRLPRTHRLWLEAELVHLKTYARVDAASGSGRVNGSAAAGVRMSDVVQGFSMSHGLNLLLGNLLVRTPLGSDADRLRLTVRAGAGPALPHAESVVRGARREQYELAGVAVQVGAGVEARLAAHLAATGEYKLTQASPAVQTASGELRTRARSHHGAFGLAFGF